MQKYFNSIQNSRGDAIVGARVTVMTASGVLATIYSDNGVTTQTNPMVTDENGFFAFYAADGRYNLRVIAIGIKPIAIDDILLEDIGEQLTDFEERVYPGVYETPPMTRPSGAACVEGDRCTILLAGIGYEHLRSGGTWVIPNLDATQLAMPGGSAGVGTIASGTGAVARTQQDRNRDTVHIKDYGGLCNGTFDDSDAMDRALAAIGNRGHIELSGTPRFTRAFAVPMQSQGICLFAKSQVVVKIDHNGDFFNLETLNENFGGNIWWNLTVQGPNVSYPGVGYVPPSTGAAFRMVKAYNNTFINVKVYGFLHGEYLKQAINNKHLGDCAFQFNQLNVFIDGGATNLNSWDFVKFREARVGSLLIDGGSTGPYPTMNSFKSAYWESNVPFAGGYPVGGPGDGSTSFAVKLLRTYDNDFSCGYFENNEFDVWLGNNASGNNFQKTRHAPSGDFSRLGKIMFSGAGVLNNNFNESKQVSRNITDVHVISDNASQFGNQFKWSEGFNFIPGSIASWANMDVQGSRSFQLLYGTPAGYVARDAHGYFNNPSEGTGRGQIDGIGTASATLNAAGFGEVILGSQITAATTITAISNLKNGQIFTLGNYQPTYPVTIKSSTDGINGLVLKNRKDLVLRSYSDTVTFSVSGLGKITEVGRNVLAVGIAFNAAPGNLTTGSSFTTPAQACVGAAFGDIVGAAYDKDLGGVQVTGYVSAPGFIRGVFTNLTGGTVALSNGTLTLRVLNA